MRQIVLDTETTGLEPAQGHRIIEIGCVELIHRRPSGNTYHQYLQPDRAIDEGAAEVHGITEAFLADKPRFANIAEELLRFIEGAELVIHNAPFDVGFLDYELELLGGDRRRVADCCRVVDTLMLARQLHPGQKNSLDALCKRYEVDNAQREYHGALLDAEILADVYLAMTGGQAALSLDGAAETAAAGAAPVRVLDPSRPPLPVVRATDEELAAHAAFLERIDEASAGRCLWRHVASADEPSGESG